MPQLSSYLMFRASLYVPALIAFSLFLFSVAQARPPFADSTDVRISTSVEHETSVFVSPLSPSTVLVFNNKGTGARATRC